VKIILQTFAPLLEDYDNSEVHYSTLEELCELRRGHKQIYKFLFSDKEKVFFELGFKAEI
jgi:hypothetical protein